ncbi:benzoate carboxyl methyltransferase [Tanacetum coccineum]
MTVANILHMSSGDGESSYAKNSLLQETVIYKTLPILNHTIRRLCNANVISSQYFKMADLGCSSSKNTLLVASNIVEIVYEVCTENNVKPPQFEVCLNDLFGNDFNNIIKMLPDFYANFRKEMSANPVLCFISAVPGIIMLNKVPEGIENNGLNIFMAKTSPHNVFEAYGKQFQADFTKFLQMRSEEIVCGGCMVLTFLGRRTRDPTRDDSGCIWELLAHSLLDMLKEGLVRESYINSFNIPNYFPCEDEVVKIIKNEGSFSLDKLDVFEVNWDPMDTDYENTKDSNEPGHNHGKNTANLIRAVSESLLISHFGSSILEMLFKKYEKHVTSHLAKTKTRFYNVNTTQSAGVRTLFSIRLHHGGSFTSSPGRSYINGQTHIVDELDSDEFSVHEIDSIVEELGNDGHKVMFYHFLKPDSDLDYGLQPLGSDQDVLFMAKYVEEGHKLIDEVEIEEDVEVLNNDYFESDSDEENELELEDDEPRQYRAGSTKVSRKMVVDVNVGQSSESAKDAGQISGGAKDAGQSSGGAKDAGQSSEGNSAFVNDFYSSYDPYVESQDPKFDPFTDLDCHIHSSTKTNVGIRMTYIEKGEEQSEGNDRQLIIKLPTILLDETVSFHGSKNRDETFDEVEIEEDVEVLNNDYFETYGIVETENTDSWTWFLTQLGDDLDLYRNSNFTFISDRQKGIIPAIAKLFPCAEHRFCVKHIHENMKQKWKGAAYKEHLWKCATSTSIEEFNVAMQEFKAFSLPAYEWLLKIPPQHCKSHFSGTVMRQPSTQLNGEEELTGRIPCKHAVATNWNMSLNHETVGLPEEWVHPCYRLETWKKVYSYKVNPIRGRLYWPKCNVPSILLPPEHQPQVGRPQKARRKSQLERDALKIGKSGKLTRNYKTVTCDKCGSKGHNSRTCTGPRNPQSQTGKRKTRTAGEDDMSGTQTTAASQRGTRSDYAAADKGKGVAVDDGSNKKKCQPRKKIINIG